MLMACVRLLLFSFNSCIGSNASVFLLPVELNQPGASLKDCHKVRATNKTQPTQSCAVMSIYGTSKCGDSIRRSCHQTKLIKKRSECVRRSLFAIYGHSLAWSHYTQMGTMWSLMTFGRRKYLLFFFVAVLTMQIQSKTKNNNQFLGLRRCQIIPQNTNTQTGEEEHRSYLPHSRNVAVPRKT